MGERIAEAPYLNTTLEWGMSHILPSYLNLTVFFFIIIIYFIISKYPTVFILLLLPPELVPTTLEGANEHHRNPDQKDVGTAHRK
jgi:hypothetical protein